MVQSQEATWHRLGSLAASLLLAVVARASAQDDGSHGHGYGEVLPGGATFYGDADGFGVQGGACGYGDLEAAGYSLYIAAGSPPLYKGGLGCGACYRVKCVDSPYCTGEELVVPITDWCPGGNWCCDTCDHFDLSQPAFRKIADIKAGHVPLQYSRVPCGFGGPIVFVVMGSVYWMNVLLENVAGPGEISALEVSWDGGSSFHALHHAWGANWVYDSGMPVAPLAFRVSSNLGGRVQAVVTSASCLPQNWASGTYRCAVQFDAPSSSNTTTATAAPPPPPPPAPIEEEKPKREQADALHAQSSPPPSPESTSGGRRRKGRHPPGKGKHPPGKGRHPPGKGKHRSRRGL